MLNLPATLAAREEPVRAGVIGAGLFGTNVIGQVERVPGLTTAAVADVETEKAVAALAGSGVSRDRIASVDDPASADDAMAAGERAVLADGLDLARTGVDVVVEATGVPNAAARHASAAIEAGNHVVMVTVEADTVVGPALARLAEGAGVTYSMAYGDQPALIVELVDWATLSGFDVVAAGKGNAYLEENRYGGPEDVFERIGFDPETVEALDLNPRMYNSFFDGTKVAVEMCAVADATGLRPDVTGMHLPTAEIPEIPGKLRPAADGGLLSEPGAVDTVSTLHPDGTPVDESVEMGVFVVTSTPDERVHNYLQQYAGTGFHTANEGRYGVFYRPHHLPGLETPVSIASAALRNEPTGVARERVGEVVAAAKRDLVPGDELDGGGGSTVYGLLADADVADREGYVPFELLEGAEVVGEIETDGIVTREDVALETDSFLYHLRKLG